MGTEGSSLSPGLDDLLGVRAEMNHPLFAVVLGLVAVGAILPDGALGREVNRPNETGFPWATSGPKLKANHRPESAV